MNMDFIKINLALDINAQRILSQYQMYSEELEKQVEKGIQLALEELSGEDFVNSVKEQTLAVFKNIVRDKLWNVAGVKHQLHTLIDKKLDDRLNTYAEQMVDKVTENIDKLLNNATQQENNTQNPH